MTLLLSISGAYDTVAGFVENNIGTSIMLALAALAIVFIYRQLNRPKDDKPSGETITVDSHDDTSEHGDKEGSDGHHDTPKESGDKKEGGKAKDDHAHPEPPKPLPLKTRGKLWIIFIVFLGAAIGVAIFEINYISKAGDEKVHEWFPDHKGPEPAQQRQTLKQELHLEPGVWSTPVVVQRIHFRSDCGTATVDLHLMWPDGSDSTYTDVTMQTPLHYRHMEGMTLSWRCDKKAYVAVKQYD